MIKRKKFPTRPYSTIGEKYFETWFFKKPKMVSLEYSKYFYHNLTILLSFDDFTNRTKGLSRFHEILLWSSYEKDEIKDFPQGNILCSQSLRTLVSEYPLFWYNTRRVFAAQLNIIKPRFKISFFIKLQIRNETC